MGNAESAGTSSPYAKVGYHVLLVSPGSPSAGVLFPFWDIIVGSQGQVFDKDDNKLVQMFQSNVGKPLLLHVYSLKNDRTREVTIVPNNTWGSGGLAGLHIRFCNFESLLELVWHVLDVYVDSPASEAQLVARTDYIIGIPEKAFGDPEDFFNHINNHLRQPVQLFVYNAVTEAVRIVTITPNSEWGGNGTLGCDIGYGYLHRIPTRPVAGQAPRASPSITSVPMQPHIDSPSKNTNSSHSPSIAPASAPPLSPPTARSTSPATTVSTPPRVATPPPSTFTPPPLPSFSSPPATPPTVLAAAPTPVPAPVPNSLFGSTGSSDPPTYTAPFAPLSSFPPPSAFAPPSSSSPYDPSVPFVPAPLPPYSSSAIFPPPSSSSMESPLQKHTIMTAMNDNEHVGL